MAVTWSGRGRTRQSAGDSPFCCWLFSDWSNLPQAEIAFSRIYLGHALRLRPGRALRSRRQPTPVIATVAMPAALARLESRTCRSCDPKIKFLPLDGACSHGSLRTCPIEGKELGARDWSWGSGLGRREVHVADSTTG